MTEKQLIEIGARYFDLYTKHQVLFATEDGNVFIDRNPAIDHARKSGIKWYELTRNAKEAQTDIDPQEQLYEQLQAEALTIDPKTGDYKDMLRILNGLHLQPESRKKADVQAAFEAYVEKLKAEQPAEAVADDEQPIQPDNPETEA